MELGLIFTVIPIQEGLYLHQELVDSSSLLLSASSDEETGVGMLLGSQLDVIKAAGQTGPRYITAQM